MSAPTRKVGGLYGGIQFSSTTIQAPSTAADPTPITIEKRVVEVPQAIQSAAAVSAPASATKDPGTTSDAGGGVGGKATAGILYLPLALL